MVWLLAVLVENSRGDDNKVSVRQLFRRLCSTTNLKFIKLNNGLVFRWTQNIFFVYLEIV
jgi:hypothetical protein